jgi:hypothetical protein
MSSRSAVGTRPVCDDTRQPTWISARVLSRAWVLRPAMGTSPLQALFKWRGVVFRRAVIEEPGLGSRRARGVWREAMAVRQRLRISDAISHFAAADVAFRFLAVQVRDIERMAKAITKERATCLLSPRLSRLLKSPWRASWRKSDRSQEKCKINYPEEVCQP